MEIGRQGRLALPFLFRTITITDRNLLLFEKTALCGLQEGLMAAASTLPFTTTPHKRDVKRVVAAVLGTLFLALHGFISTFAGAMLRF